MIISDEQKAINVLNDVGYYRLGFYWFPFELTYPNKTRRNHNFIAGTTFENAVLLYNIDFRLRNILSPYLYRIEVHLRTAITYQISNIYKNNPKWFSDSKYVQKNFLSYLPDCYKTVLKAEAIKNHHKNHKDDKYAPAWKTLEYLSFGDILFLLKNIKEFSVRDLINKHFGYIDEDIFLNHIGTVKVVRNLCAHGHNVYDLNLQKSIKQGPVKELVGFRNHNIVGCLLVISNMLNTISPQLTSDLAKEINELISEDKYIDVSDKIQILMEAVKLIS
jgi:abortive infection bacteriophage resistance protein